MPRAKHSQPTRYGDVIGLVGGAAIVLCLFLLMALR